MLDIGNFSKDPIGSHGSDSQSGKGMHSTVYEGQVKGTVLKVTNDFKCDGYTYFLYKVLTSQPNRLFPKIFAVHIDVDKEELYVLMEDLLTQCKALDTIDTEMSTKIRFHKRFENEEDVENFSYKQYLRPEFLKKDNCRDPIETVTHKNFRNFLHDIIIDKHDPDIFGPKPTDHTNTSTKYPANNGFFLDAHDENWMYRKNGEIVLIDPFHIIKGFNIEKLYALAETLNFVTITGEPNVT